MQDPYELSLADSALMGTLQPPVANSSSVESTATLATGSIDWQGSASLEEESCALVAPPHSSKPSPARCRAPARVPSRGADIKLVSESSDDDEVCTHDPGRHTAHEPASPQLCYFH